MYKYILFDLDGTITDPGIGITNSVAYALRKYCIEVKERSELYKFIGPPLHWSFREYYGFTEEEAITAVQYYREYYADKGLFENYVYDGIPEMLETLRSHGLKCIMATSKPEQFAIRILEHFGLAKAFDFVAGATMDTSRTDKALVIKYALESNGIQDLSEVVMVGDREHDVLGAAKNGLKTIGVTYGYGSREELTNAGAFMLADSPQEVTEICVK